MLPILGCFSSEVEEYIVQSSSHYFLGMQSLVWTQYSVCVCHHCSNLLFICGCWLVSYRKSASDDQRIVMSCFVWWPALSEEDGL
jgi:hypothetical protein